MRLVFRAITRQGPKQMFTLYPRAHLAASVLPPRPNTGLWLCWTVPSRLQPPVGPNDSQLKWGQRTLLSTASWESSLSMTSYIWSCDFPVSYIHGIGTWFTLGQIISSVICLKSVVYLYSCLVNKDSTFGSRAQEICTKLSSPRHWCSWVLLKNKSHKRTGCFHYKFTTTHLNPSWQSCLFFE